MRVAAFMSGTGTNIRKLLEYQKALEAREGKPPFEVVFIFSDRSDGACKGEKIALEYGLPYFSYDIRAFHRLRSIKRTVKTPEGMVARRRYDEVPAKLVEAFEIDLIALGGYMSFTTLQRCVNVHPADLSILTPDGKRKYVGDDAVADAIRAGEEELRSSTLWTDQGVDTGPLLMVSRPVPVELPKPLAELLKDKEAFARVVAQHQERLKEMGDWKIFPRTIELVARGEFAIDDKNKVYFKGEWIPEGYRE